MVNLKYSLVTILFVCLFACLLLTWLALVWHIMVSMTVMLVPGLQSSQPTSFTSTFEIEFHKVKVQRRREVDTGDDVLNQFIKIIFECSRNLFLFE